MPKKTMLKALCLTALALASAAVSGGERASASITINVRSQQAQDSRIVAVLQRGEAVEILGQHGEFSQVRLASGKTGYLKTKYLKPLAAAPTPTPARAPVPAAAPAAAPAAPIPAALAAAAPADQAASAPDRARGAPAAEHEDLTELSLDALLDIEVTSVSKRAEPLGRAAAAVYVVSGEEIRRGGLRSIAEALRWAPGMNVARSNANTYSISARGFQNTGDKLQVLVDGRSVYTPLTSSVFWDVLDTYIHDIERIEVIRGPGATLWGANAVNGVINVITRSASDTRGGRASLSAGSEDLGLASLRSGTAAGSSGDIRFYAQARERDNAFLASGGDAMDGQRLAQAGLRGDWQPAADQQLMISGDFYNGRNRARGAISQGPVDIALSGANLNTRWSLQTGGQNSLSVNLSFDRYERLIPETYAEQRDTYDFGLQHQLALGESQELTYGLSYRHSRDETGGPPLLVIFSPASRSIQTYGAFVQDQVRFGEHLVWTLGSKFEHNDFTGSEIQPGTRLGWQASPSWFTWAAVSQATRTPNRLDHDIAIFCPPPAGFPGLCGPNVTLPIGSRDFDSEKLLAYEWGLRFTGSARWSADLAAFYNDYRDLRSSEAGLKFANRLDGQGAGAELALTWKPAATLDLRGNYSFLDLDIEAESGSSDVNSAPTLEGASPRHQAGLRLFWQATPTWSLDSRLRHVSRLERSANPSATSGPTSVPAYTELDLHLGWKPWPSLEIGLTGENLLDSAHPEYGASNSRSELQRAGLLSIHWSWQ